FIGPESSFRDGNALRCPQCNSTDGIELYHKRYYCPDCKNESNEVNISFKCGACGAFYDESNMEVKPFRTFELSKEGLENYEKISGLLNEQLMKLRAQGYVIERPATLVGESGVIHTFEAIAKKGDEVIAIAISLGEPLTQTLFRLGIAKSDLNFKKLILITSKAITPVERDFARSLGIELIGIT
ncbi:MAG: hypothetical protein J7L83_04165, partial [Thaumarchaeota archaeon]|nr:hypothetical protein [Nitrososphaerota archaeon]